MTEARGLPPGVGPEDRVVLFDGVCRLCSGWVRFLIRFDRERRFRLAPVQSPEGQAILEWYGLPTDHYETVLLVEGARLSTKSTAVLRVMGGLPFPWWLAAIGRIVPRRIRDWLYDRIARNRYRLFGRREACLRPAPEHASRFLGG
jgi:predicted DCC family thiol-disulfide oxidoreductase YuxK